MSHVKVVSRFRPPNALELREGGDIVVDFDGGENTTVRIKGGPTSGPEADGFTYDRVFPMHTRQRDVFDFGIRDTVDDVLNGYNGTIFAYGQTGSGKTYTMMGSDIDDEEQKGIIPRITEQIFTSIMQSPPNLEYLVKVSYMEIYMERIRDLLAPQNDNLQIHEEKTKGVYVKGLSDFYVGGQADVYEIMRQGGMARAVSSTNMNAESSRSHSIFLVTIQQRNTETGSQKTGNLYLVDLAGSEKVGKTGASGQTLEEAKKINKSLSALGMVINALTDGKSSHIPYRDSKLTRILQESLGGNSRTTLIINCSPCAFNQDETISTLRFGVRAKSIKNKARINAELSPLELKALLRKAQAESTKQTAYIQALEAELQVWRSGGKVAEAEWADPTKVLGGAAAPTAAAAAAAGATANEAPATPASKLANGAAARPQTPAVEGLRELASRPDTPTAVSIERDEREEFLRRENELADQISEKDASLKNVEAELRATREELEFYKEREATLSEQSKGFDKELDQQKLLLEKERAKCQDLQISADALQDQVGELKAELEELRRSLQEQMAAAKEAGAGARSAAQEEKEREKAERMAKMMADFNAGIVSEKEEQIRETLSKLELASTSSSSAGAAAAAATAASAGALSAEDIAMFREQLLESQTLLREQHERMRQAHEENELLNQRREEVESRLDRLEIEYDELLDKAAQSTSAAGGGGGVGGGEGGLAELRERLEAQFAAKREAQQSEIADLKRQMALKSKELGNLQSTNESLRAANDELKRAFAITAAGMEGGKTLAETAREMERVRKTMATQLAEFDNMKRSLMRDLQNRCEKVVELEMSLDESKEQYNNVIRSSNSKAQQKKMAFLERNLEQLTNVQKQLVEQNSSLKKEVAIAERKLLARNERIQALEAHLVESQERLAAQNRKFEEQLQVVKERLNQAKEARALGVGVGGGAGVGAAGLMGGGVGGGAGLMGGGAAAAASGLAGFGRIAKPIRGGGGPGAGPQPGPNAVAAGALKNPALSSLQGGGADASNSPKARSSWFFSSSKQP